MCSSEAPVSKEVSEKLGIFSINAFHLSAELSATLNFAFLLPLSAVIFAVLKISFEQFERMLIDLGGSWYELFWNSAVAKWFVSLFIRNATQPSVSSSKTYAWQSKWRSTTRWMASETSLTTYMSNEKAFTSWSWPKEKSARCPSSKVFELALMTACSSLSCPHFGCLRRPEKDWVEVHFSGRDKLLILQCPVTVDRVKSVSI